MTAWAMGLLSGALAVIALQVGVIVYLARKPFVAMDKLDEAQKKLTADTAALGVERLEHERALDGLREELEIAHSNVKAAAEMTTQERRMRTADLAELTAVTRQRDALLQAIQVNPAKASSVAALVRAELERLQGNAARASSTAIAAETKPGGR
jgi:hypothetical protein